MRSEIVQVERAVVDCEYNREPIQIKYHAEIATWRIEQLDRPIVLALQFLLTSS